jgi:hypothetical protein
VANRDTEVMSCGRVQNAFFSPLPSNYLKVSNSSNVILILIILIIIIIIITVINYKNSRIWRCTHTTESDNVKLQNIFHGRNNITCSTDCKYRTAATLYTLETCFFFFFFLNTLHKCDNNDDDDDDDDDGDNDDDDNNNNNNNNNKPYCKCDHTTVSISARQRNKKSHPICFYHLE